MKELQGVIGLILSTYWLRQSKEQIFGPDGFGLVFRAIDWLHDVTGSYNYVAIGSDLDGFIQPIKTCPTYAQTPSLEEALKARYGTANAERILFRNAMDVLGRGWN